MAGLDLDGLTRCFAGKVGAWFAANASFPAADLDERGASGGPASVEQLTFLRQTNMTLALAASKWSEFRTLHDADAIPRMRSWLDEVEARAEVRGAEARAQAIREARAWFESCAGDAAPRGGP